jgi:hypothetical protein
MHNYPKAIRSLPATEKAPPRRIHLGRHSVFTNNAPAAGLGDPGGEATESRAHCDANGRRLARNNVAEERRREEWLERSDTATGLTLIPKRRTIWEHVPKIDNAS